MAAVGFFYAGVLHIQWQLLIIVIFLFFGTVAFLSVLFNETTDDFLTTPVTVTVQDNADDDSYQNYSSSIA